MITADSVAADEIVRSPASDASPRPAPAAQIRRIPVTIEVSLGRRRLTVAELLALKPGDAIPLDRAVNEPVDVYVNGERFARGEIVVVDESSDDIGVKIIEIVSGA